MLGLWISEMGRIWKRKRMVLLCVLYIIGFAINLIALSSKQKGEFTDPSASNLVLHALNIPWFIVNELSIIFQFVLLPILFVESIGGELSSGAYRLYMLRPIPKYYHLLTKLIALIITFIILLGATCLFSFAFGWLLFPHGDLVPGFNGMGPLSFREAIVFTLKFYAVYSLGCIAKLFFSSVVTLFIPKPLFSFLCIFGGIIALYQLIPGLYFLMDPFITVLQAIGPNGKTEFWVYVALTILICAIISFWKWRRTEL